MSQNFANMYLSQVANIWCGWIIRLPICYSVSVVAPYPALKQPSYHILHGVIILLTYQHLVFICIILFFLNSEQLCSNITSYLCMD